MIASILLLLLSATNPDVSLLVDPGHTHSWREVSSDEEGKISVDEAYRGELKQNSTNYETILARANWDPGEENGGRYSVDLILAVDCEKQRIGVMQSQMKMPTTGQSVNSEYSPVVMDFSDVPLSKKDIALIQYACGTEPTP
ncbi:MAG: hypothetical protein AAF687_05730 [Pseudomonadota bacterium]